MNKTSFSKWPATVINCFIVFCGFSMSPRVYALDLSDQCNQVKTYGQLIKAINSDIASDECQNIEKLNEILKSSLYRFTIREAANDMGVPKAGLNGFYERTSIKRNVIASIFSSISEHPRIKVEKDGSGFYFFLNNYRYNYKEGICSAGSENNAEPYIVESIDDETYNRLSSRSEDKLPPIISLASDNVEGNIFDVGAPIYNSYSRLLAVYRDYMAINKHHEERKKNWNNMSRGEKTRSFEDFTSAIENRINGRVEYFDLKEAKNTIESTKADIIEECQSASKVRFSEIYVKKSLNIIDAIELRRVKYMRFVNSAQRAVQAKLDSIKMCESSKAFELWRSKNSIRNLGDILKAREKVEKIDSASAAVLTGGYSAEWVIVNRQASFSSYKSLGGTAKSMDEVEEAGPDPCPTKL